MSTVFLLHESICCHIKRPPFPIGGRAAFLSLVFALILVAILVAVFVTILITILVIVLVIALVIVLILVIALVIHGFPPCCLCTVKPLS